jgi:hypothetical protein
MLLYVRSTIPCPAHALASQGQGSKAWAWQRSKGRAAKHGLGPCLPRRGSASVLRTYRQGMKLLTSPAHEVSTGFEESTGIASRLCLLDWKSLLLKITGLCPTGIKLHSQASRPWPFGQGLGRGWAGQWTRVSRQRITELKQI